MPIIPSRRSSASDLMNVSTGISRVSQALVRAITRKPNGLCFIFKLPYDILVDELLKKLDVKEVLAMRGVNKYFYQLTLAPIIWKNLLGRMNIVPPPLPPAAKYSKLSEITSFEAEKMVIRAISFQDNWQCEHPVAYEFHTFFVQHNVLSLEVLPGGKHLVASVTDYGHKLFWVMVLVVDYRHGGLVPLARIPTETRAYNLRVKYMSIKGVMGIVVGYVRREFYGDAYASSGNLLDPSDYSDAKAIDPPFPMRYECVCLTISVEALEDLANNEFPPGSAEFFQRAKAQLQPFSRISRIRSRSQMDTIDIATIRGIPYVAVAKRPETILFKNLDTGVTSSLRIARMWGFDNIEHIIHNFKIMPYHLDVLVVASIPLTEPEYYPPEDLSIPPPAPLPGARTREGILYASIFNIPGDGNDLNSEEPFESKLLQDGIVFDDVQISDPVLPSRLNCSIRSVKLQAEDPPISIYYRNVTTRDMMEVRIRPCRPDSLQPLRNTYFDSVSTFWLTNFDSEDVIRPPGVTLVGNVLPGHSRPLVWTTTDLARTDSPPLHRLWSYMWDIQGRTDDDRWKLEDEDIDMNSDEDEDEVLPLPICVSQKPKRPTSSAAFLLPIALKKALSRGIKGIAWDDWTGRLFVATTHDCAIHIIDLSQGPKEDSGGQRLPVVDMD